MSTKTNSPSESQDNNIWMRALYMIIFVFLFGIAETLLLVAAVIQFFWIVFKKEANEGLSKFGCSLGNWLKQVAEFQVAQTEEKPFPWKKWE